MTGKPGELGAALQPKNQWQEEKTAASLAFINETETFLKTCTDIEKKRLLAVAIAKVQSSEIVLREWLTPQEYLSHSGFPPNSL